MPKECAACLGSGEDFDPQLDKIITCEACGGTGFESDDGEKAEPKKASPKKKAEPKEEIEDAVIEEISDEDAEMAELERKLAEKKAAKAKADEEKAAKEKAAEPKVTEPKEAKPKAAKPKAAKPKAAKVKPKDAPSTSTALIVQTDPAELACLFATEEEVNAVVPAGTFAGHENTILDAVMQNTLPRVHISQPQSDAVVNGHVPAGVFFRGDTFEDLGKQIQLIPLAIVGQRVLFDGDEMGKVICAAFGSMVAPDHGEKLCDRCRHCPKQEWGKDEDGKSVKPECTTYQTILALVTGPDGAPFLATIGNKRTQLVIVQKQLINPILALNAKYGAPSYATRWACCIEGKKTKKGAYFSRSFFQVGGFIQDKEKLDQLKALVDEHLPALRAGAAGFLVKDTPPAELVQAIQESQKTAVAAR